MIIVLQRYPFVPLSLSLVLGIGLVGCIDVPSHHLLLVIVLAGGMAAALCNLIRHRMARYLSSYLILFSVVALGFLIRTSQNPQHTRTHFSHFIEDSNKCIFRIDHQSDRTLTASILQVNDHAVEGSFLIRQNEQSKSLQPYDLVFAELRFAELPAPLNPREFDAKAWYESKKIYHQTYLNSALVLEMNTGGWLQGKLEYLRNLCLQKLQQIPGENERAIAMALILGYKDELGSDLKNAFADTGAIHILAVSGLHVGIIYGIIFWLTTLLPKGPWHRLIKSITTIIGIWLFAGLTGGAPSVIRAAGMFSLFELGRLVDRSAIHFNSLGVAAFFFLLIDPHALQDLGFQLSFLAVAGIILCQRPIEELWIIENSLGHKLWTLVSVSLAAQMFTLPLTLYYFHQFPLYFWLTGIVVVPLAGVILATGLAYLVGAVIPIVGSLLLKILFGQLFFLKSLIYLIRKIPFVTIDQIWLGPLEMVFIILVLIFFTIALLTRRSKLIVSGLVCVLFVSGLRLVAPFLFDPEPSATIYHIRGKSYADVLSVGSAAIVNLDDLPNPDQRYELKNQYDYYQVANIYPYHEIEEPARLQPFLQMLGKKIFLVNRKIDWSTSVPPVEIIWLQDGFEIDNLVKGTQDLPLFILDGSIERNRAYRLAQEIESLGFPVHLTWRDGAYRWTAV